MGRLLRTLRGSSPTARWLPLLLVGAGALAYSNTLSAPFVFDDDRAIVGNATIQSAEQLWGALLSSNRPVLMLSLAANYAVGGLDVTGYHVVNIAIHILAGLTLFGVMRRTLLLERWQGRYAGSAPWLAFVVALLWLLHPLQTQAVTYLIQRGESMAGLFYLLTLYCVIRSATGTRHRVWTAAALAAFCLGVGSKEVAATAPLVVLLYDRTFLARSSLAALGQRPMLYAGFAAVWLTGLATLLLRNPYLEGSAGFGIEPISSLEYARAQPGVLLHYLRLSLWPHPLCFDYAWPPARTAREILPAAAAIGVLLAATAWALWRRSWLGFLGAWFFLILLPTSSFMPLIDLAVEHRMYLSLASLVLLVVMGGHWALVRWTARPGWIAGLLVVVLSASLGLATFRRNHDYRSRVSIWESVVRVAPENPRGHVNLGVILEGQGQRARAIRSFRRALGVRPGFPHAHYLLGLAFQQQGQLDPAIFHYREALAAAPRDVDSLFQLGLALGAQDQLQEAIEAFRKVLSIRPSSPIALINLGELLAETGDPDAGVEHALRGVRILATHPDPVRRDTKLAVHEAERLVARTQRRNPEALETLATAYAADGQLERAASATKAALALGAGARAAGQVEDPGG